MDGTSEAGGGGTSWAQPGGPGDASMPPTRPGPYTPPIQQSPGPWGDHRAWGAPVNALAQPPVSPSSMQLAKALMFAGAGLTVLSLFVYFAMVDQLADAVADDMGTSRGFSVDREVDKLQSQQVGRSVLWVGLWIWMALKNGQGRKWARVVATIFCVINVLGTVAGGLLVGSGDYVGEMSALLAVGVVSSVLGVVILVLLFRPDASDFYSDSERWKASRVLRGY